MTARLKKIIREIESLDSAEQEDLRKHLGGQNGQARGLTRRAKNAYNASMPTAAITRRKDFATVGRKIAEHRHKLGLLAGAPGRTGRH